MSKSTRRGRRDTRKPNPTFEGDIVPEQPNDSPVIVAKKVTKKVTKKKATRKRDA